MDILTILGSIFSIIGGVIAIVEIGLRIKKNRNKKSNRPTR